MFIYSYKYTDTNNKYMTELQNYLDRYVLDTLCWRVVSCVYRTDLKRHLNDLRDHEKPHILVIWNVSGSYINLPDYHRIHTDDPVWISVHHKILSDIIVFQKPIHRDDAIRLQEVNIPFHDIHPDPKGRYTGTSTTQEKWLKVTGDMFYVESRSIGNDMVMTRICTKQVLSKIITHKLPVYAYCSDSIRGRFLFNITQNTHRCLQIGTVRILHKIKNEDRHYKGKIPVTSILNITSKDILNMFLTRHYLNRTGDYISITIRGRYLLFYYTQIYSDTDKNIASTD